MTVEDFIQSVRNALPFLRNLDRGQRRAIVLFGGVPDHISPDPELQKAVSDSLEKTVDITTKCNTVLSIYDQLTAAIAALQATEFPDPKPTRIPEQKWDDALTINSEVSAAYGEMTPVPTATSLNLTVLPLRPKREL